MVAQIEKSIASTVEPPVESPMEPPLEARQRYTPEEYLAIEAEAVERHEYRDRERIAMAGGLPNHNQIAGNIYTTFNFALRQKAYQAFITDQRLWIPQRQIYTYPDVMVMSLPLELQDGRKDTVMNPLLIVEVLSDSTADYDRGEKFAAYRSIPGFQEYLLVSQSSQQIDHFVKRSEKKWDFQVYDETDTVVQLETISVEIAIGDIYDKVDFEVT